LNILVADIGGTKTCLSLIRIKDSTQEHQSIKKEYYVSNQYQRFDLLLKTFLNDQPIEAACLAVAGPVTQNRQVQTSEITNLPWKLNTRHISQQFNIPNVALVNDFAATAYGIDALKKTELIDIQANTHKPASQKAIIGAGTGLGQAFMIWNNNAYNAYSTEGGHVDFAPTDQQQRELLEFLTHSTTPISYEHLLSGNGIVRIYSFLHQLAMPRQNPYPRLDSADEISQIALADASSLAGQAMKLFVRIYGAQAGNLALNTLPYDGIYIAGGIAAKNSPFFTDGNFLDAFLNKPKMQQILKSIPVKLIMNQEVGLLGAIKQAKLLSSGSKKNG